MAQNGLNTGLRRPNYKSPLSDYVLQTELPMGRKIPKFTKFSGDTSESTTEHIARFRFLKARCFTVVPEHELIEMAAGGLDYSIGKKSDTQYLRDMAQLADGVRQVERLKAEKARANNSYEKERVTYVEVDKEEPETFEDQYGFEDCEVDLAELKEAGPYTCKMITPSNGKKTRRD
ncbi:uncharacterized protein LOC131659190 [Vicia villosa]|uniref:uncharacterized protein LOC131659190 n=1 Tax=Vicia villosa TaxID=3911 RepID=UPI00273CF2D0|nr:uncharacterized protein LOC131659190 [Vicia villosa]